MKIDLVIENRRKTYFAEAVYTKENFVVLAGGQIVPTFSDHIQGGKKALTYRNDRSYVDDKGRILKDCIFKSPSTAAQFVLGISRNGYAAWKTKDGKKLGIYLKEKGLR